MANSEVTVFTVPEGWWWETSVSRVNSYRKVVGIIAPNGDEIWLPDSASDYVYGGSYSKGYSKKDIAEDSLALEADMAARLASFFENNLMRMRWVDQPRSAERYDCHWFAFVLRGAMRADGVNDPSLEIAEQFIRDGKLDPRYLKLGEIGVVGLRNLNRVSAEHSMIGLGDGNCLQVMGIHDVVGVSEQIATAEYYREISNEYHMTDHNYGLFVQDQVH